MVLWEDMMGGSRFIPILIAGLVGLIVGWWAAPDFDEASETMAGQIEELKAPIGQIQTNEIGRAHV